VDTQVLLTDTAVHRASINKQECFALSALETAKNEELNEMLIKDLQQELGKLRLEKQELSKEIERIKKNSFLVYLR
jgi:hypothetical protein